jgi:DNA polymerase-1
MAFVPSPGCKFVGSDLSQIEPRTLSHILYEKFGDDSLKSIYDRGEDIYVQKAMEVFGFPLENCVDGAYDPTGTFKPRKALKDGVLAYCYDQQPPAFARKQKLPMETAYKFFDSMKKAIPSLPLFRTWVFDRLATHGNNASSETMWGRKRRYPKYRDDKRELDALERKCYIDGLDVYRQGGPKGRTDEERAEVAARVERVKNGQITEDDKEAILRIGLNFRNKDKKDRLWELRRSVSDVQRQAVNHVIQGSAADILKQNIIRLFNVCQERGWRFLTSIHDEVFLELPDHDVTNEALDIIEDCMTKTVQLSVPLKSDSVIQPRWMDEYRRHEWDFENCRPKTKEAS